MEASITPGGMSHVRRAAWLSFVLSIVLLVVKFTAYVLTDSAAVLSDALESIVNIVAGGFALFSVTLSARPPDDSHPYGHGRIEFFSAGFEGGLIVVAGLAICATAIPRLITPQPLGHMTLGMGLVCGAGVANALVGWYLQRAGQREHSLALIADGKHLLSDAYTSAGVLVGMVCVWASGWLVLDGLAALLIAGHILVMGMHLVRESVARLMDEAEPALLQRIVDTLRTARQASWIDLHNLRAWRSGPRYHVDFHLTLPRNWDLERCHAVAEDVEGLIQRTQPTHGDVIIHLDPCVPAACTHCAMADCTLRSSAQQDVAHWSVASAIGGPLTAMPSVAASAC